MASEYETPEVEAQQYVGIDLHRRRSVIRSITGREELAALPELRADAEALPDDALLRAASLLAHFAHLYVRARPDPPDRLPAGIQRPWETVSRRLGRIHAALTYDDLVSYNWRFVDPHEPHRRLENLAVLTPTVNNREERIFYMTQVEVLAASAPAVGVVVRAQEAAAVDDEPGVARELAELIDVVRSVTPLAFRKIDQTRTSDVAHNCFLPSSAYSNNRMGSCVWRPCRLL